MEVMEASPGSSIAVVKFEDYQGNLESKEGSEFIIKDEIATTVMTQDKIGDELDTEKMDVDEPLEAAIYDAVESLLEAVCHHGVISSSHDNSNNKATKILAGPLNHEGTEVLAQPLNDKAAEVFAGPFINDEATDFMGSSHMKVEVGDEGGTSSNLGNELQSNANKLETDNDGEAVQKDTEREEDCQIVANPPASSAKSFRLRQRRVEDYLEMPNQSFKESPSYKYKLPCYVDKFNMYFSFVRVVPPTRKAKRPRTTYLFRCKHCFGLRGAKNLRITCAWSFLSHLKMNHGRLYSSVIANNPGFAPKKLKRKTKKHH